ncbi:MAG: ABC transporter permease [Solirubrobacterales bacterium]|nr:ABC transporter permease [Solirubrobacterales bacterium]
MNQVTASEPPVAPGVATEKKPERLGPMRSVLGSRGFQGSISFLAFLVVFVGYAIWLGDTFASTQARSLDIHQNAPVLILGLAVMLTLIAGQFDLSVGGMATLTTYLAIGLKITQDWPFVTVIAVCLIIGLVGGLINGFLVVRLGVNTFIATLGTGGVFAGIASVYGKGTQLSPTADSKGKIPGWFSGADSLGSFNSKFPSVILWIAVALLAIWCFTALRRRRPDSQAPRTWCAISAGIVLLGVAIALLAVRIDHWVSAVSWTIGVLLIIALVMWLMLGHTTFGRYLHATGSNPEAARLAGVDPGRETVKAFVLGGLLAATAGIVLAANQSSASPDVAAGFLLPAFAAAFLSTVVLSTGRFTVWGAVIGGTFLVWVSQGLIVGGLPFTWSEVVNGVVLIIAVAMSTVFFRRQTT